jgi:ribosomal-protein-alanine N-acetyltransferase
VIGVLTLPNVLRLKALAGGELAGFVAADIRPGRREAWIATIGVLPEYRRRGIGAALLAATEQGLSVERVKLCVRYSNTPAIRLYQQLGYVRIDVWRRYYADGEDAIVFEKML